MPSYSFGDAAANPSLSIVIIEDNCKVPVPSLLHRLRTREMMNLSALRWDSTPGAMVGFPAHGGSFSDDLVAAYTSSPVISKSSPNNPTTTTATTTNRQGPKVPRRQISPPAAKRHNPNQPPTTKPSSLPSSPAAQKRDRPNLPVRTLSPAIQPRDEEGEAAAKSSPQSRLLALSPMVRSSRLATTTTKQQQAARIPKRKSSLIVAARNEVNIHRILQEDFDLEDDNDDNNAGRLNRYNSREPPKRPSQPRRLSSFEVLPATMPTRQSSFEIRHRVASSPLLSDKVCFKICSDILHSAELSSSSSPEVSPHDTIRSSRSPQQSSSLPIHQKIQESEVQECDTTTKIKMIASLSMPQFNNAKETTPDHFMTVWSRSKNSGELDAPPNKVAAQTPPSDNTEIDLGKHLTSVACYKRAGDKEQCPSTPRQTVAAGLLSSHIQCPDSDSSSDKRRFRRFRTGSAKPSLPVRTSSLNLKTARQKSDTKSTRVPGRQSSFPGLRSSFQQL